MKPKGPAPGQRSDIKGNPIGARSGVAATMLGVVRRRVSDSLCVDSYEVANVAIASRGVGLGLLTDLYSLCERYHGARVEFDAAASNAISVMASLDNAESMPNNEWARAASQALTAADALGLVAARLDALVGLGPVAQVASAAKDSMIAHVRAGDSLERWCEARGAWHLASRRFRRRHSQNFASEVMRDGTQIDWSTDEHRLRVHMIDADSPVAVGALGIEHVTKAAQPWSSAAWRGWCCAGLKVSAAVAWDTWGILNVFALSTIGTARGASEAAVKKNRQRNPAI